MVTTTRYTLLRHYATTVLLQPAFYFLYYVTTSSRTVVSKIYLIKRASHELFSCLDKKSVLVFGDEARGQRGQAVRTIQRPWVWVLPWLLAGFVHGSPKFRSSITLVNTGFVQGLEFLKKSGKNGKKSWVFSKLQQVLYKWIFCALVKSYSISPCVCSTSWKTLCSCLFKDLYWSPIW